MGLKSLAVWLASRQSWLLVLSLIEVPSIGFSGLAEANGGRRALSPSLPITPDPEFIFSLPKCPHFSPYLGLKSQLLLGFSFFSHPIVLLRNQVPHVLCFFFSNSHRFISFALALLPVPGPPFAFLSSWCNFLTGVSDPCFFSSQSICYTLRFLLPERKTGHTPRAGIWSSLP